MKGSFMDRLREFETKIPGNERKISDYTDKKLDLQKSSLVLICEAFVRHLKDGGEKSFFKRTLASLTDEEGYEIMNMDKDTEEI